MRVEGVGGHKLYMDNFLSSSDIWWPTHKMY